LVRHRIKANFPWRHYPGPVNNPLTLRTGIRQTRLMYAVVTTVTITDLQAAREAG
jgi:hypothetical protein